MYTVECSVVTFCVVQYLWLRIKNYYWELANEIVNIIQYCSSTVLCCNKSTYNGNSVKVRGSFSIISVKQIQLIR